jgi:hypothetical protein
MLDATYYVLEAPRYHSTRRNRRCWRDGGHRFLPSHEQIGGYPPENRAAWGPVWGPAGGVGTGPVRRYRDVLRIGSSTDRNGAESTEQNTFRATTARITGRHLLRLAGAELRWALPANVALIRWTRISRSAFYLNCAT